MAGTGISSDLHLVVTHRACRLFFCTIFARGANFFKVGSLERGVEFKRDRAFPARWARLGAIDGSGCSTGVS